MSRPRDRRKLRRTYRHQRPLRPGAGIKQVVLLGLILLMVLLFWEQLSQGASSCALNLGGP